MVEGFPRSSLTGERDLRRHPIAGERQVTRRRGGQYAGHGTHALQGLARLRGKELPAIRRECSMDRHTDLDADHVLWIEAEIHRPKTHECPGEEHRPDEQHQADRELEAKDLTLQADVDPEPCRALAICA